MRIGRGTFESIEQFIADNKYSAEKVQQGIDLLARGMVLVVKANAQAQAMGPVAPNRRSNPALAYRLPVQRITGEYFAGWTQKRLGQGHWLVYNDTREAFLIETGMFQKIRRPIAKMSLIKMLEMLQTTRTGERFIDWVIASRRNEKGQFRPFSERLGNEFKMSLTAIDLPERGVGNPSIAGPQAELP